MGSDSGALDFVKHRVLLGGRRDGPVCSLLEIGSSRILLDCGCIADGSVKDLQILGANLRLNGGIDLILISHADMQHMGALPTVFGNMGLANVPIICTLPVYKMGQIMLYDYCLNNSEGGTSDAQQFTLDDVDTCLSNVTSVKYKQIMNVPSNQDITVCAYPAGRTIGGAGWLIKYRATEVFYFIDFNLRKDLVLDGARLDLPSTPSLLVLGGSIETQQKTRRKNQRDDGLISIIMQTIRNDGNVLIPTESIGRTLEILQLLHRQWTDNKMSLYQLVFLSPMATNIIEFAQSQLEWMSTDLSTDFYAGRSNPFILPKLKVASSIREIDALPAGPRVILATDASLNFGPAKDLLLRWGGDPRNCVIFTDSSDPGTLAADIRGQTPPVIATVTRMERVELVGEELSDFLESQNKAKRQHEEEIQRQKREEELEKLVAGQGGDIEEDNNDDNNNDNEIDMYNPHDTNNYHNNKSKKNNINSNNKRKRSSTASEGNIKRGMFRFAAPRFPMFETRDKDELHINQGDYGADLDDLPLVMTSSSSSNTATDLDRLPARLKSFPMPNIREMNTNGLPINNNTTTDETDQKPFKFVSRRVRVQFTCSFREVFLGGRADLKAVRTLLGTISARHVSVLRGKSHECDTVASCASQLESTTQAMALNNNEVMQLSERGERVRIELPQSLVQSCGRVVVGENSLSGASKRISCCIASLSGQVGETVTSGQAGMRVVRWIENMQGTAANSSNSNSNSNSTISADITLNKDVNTALTTTNRMGGVSQMRSASDPLMNGPSLSIGAVSVGEVLLDSLKQHLELSGVTSDYRLASSGGYLVCASQVVLRKEQENEFLLEGAPSAAFFKTRQALYQKFAFI
eukprot:gene5678-11459_t